MRQEIQEIKKLEEQTKKLREELDATKNTVKELETVVRTQRPSPVLEVAQDIATIETIYSILIKTGKVAENDIRSYVEQYKQHITAIIHLLIDKGFCTPKEYNCRIMAFHHMVRLYGINPQMSPEQLFNERRGYEKILMEMEDPLQHIGN